MQNHIKIVCSDISSQIESAHDKTIGATFERWTNKAIDEGFVPLYDTLTAVAAGTTPNRYLCILMEDRKERTTGYGKTSNK